MKDPVAKAAYDRDRRARLHVDRRPTACRVCGDPIVQAVTSVRLYCTNACRGRAFYRAHGCPPSAPLEPIPMPYVGDPIFVAARAAAGITGNYSSDWGQHDIIGEAVLAILEGRSPQDAVRAFRARQRASDALSVRLDDPGRIGLDGHGRVIMEPQEAA